MQGVDLDGGALFYACSGMVAPSSPTGSWAAAAPAVPDPLASGAFNLSSRSSAAHKLYLNFLGGNITGSAWNVGGPTSIVVPAYSTDQDDSISETERANIVTIWRMVSEDFAPWDLDVTTVRPASLAGHIHVMIGGDGAWCAKPQSRRRHALCLDAGSTKSTAPLTHACLYVCTSNSTNNVLA